MAETQGIGVYSILPHSNGQTVKVDLSTNLHEMELPWPFRLKGAKLIETDASLVIQQLPKTYDLGQPKGQETSADQVRILSHNAHPDVDPSPQICSFTERDQAQPLLSLRPSSNDFLSGHLIYLSLCLKADRTALDHSNK